MPIDALLSGFESSGWHRAQGTAVYLTAFSGNASNCLRHNLIHNEALHENVVLLTVQMPTSRSWRRRCAREVADLGNGMHRVLLRYGFMEKPDVSRDLAGLADSGMPVDPMRTTYFIGRNSFVGGERPHAAALAAEAVPDAGPLRHRAPATSSACRPTASSNSAAGSRSRDLPFAATELQQVAVRVVDVEFLHVPRPHLERRQAAARGAAGIPRRAPAPGRRVCSTTYSPGTAGRRSSRSGSPSRRA